MKALIKYVRSVLRQCYIIWVLLLPGTCPITKVHYPVFSEHLGLEQKKKKKIEILKREAIASWHT